LRANDFLELKDHSRSGSVMVILAGFRHLLKIEVPGTASYGTATDAAMEKLAL